MGTSSLATHFFRIILDDCITENKLLLPRSFVRRHRNGLSSLAILSVPDGIKWKIELVKSGNDVWLCKGYKEFADHYSLKHGHFMLFSYEGNSKFSVVLFDTSATEIDYPVCLDTEDFNFQEPKEEDSEDFAVSPNSSKRRKSPLSCARDQKKKRSNETRNAAATSKAEILGSGTPLSCAQAQTKKRSNETRNDAATSRSDILGSGKPLSCAQARRKKRRNETRNAAVRSEILGSGTPLSGAQAQKKKRSNETRNAAATSRSEILVSRREVKIGSCRQNLKATCSDNSAGKNRKQPWQEQDNSSAIQKAKAFKSRHPCFIRTMRSSYIPSKFGYTRLNLPVEFCKKYLKNNEGHIIFLSAENSWRVKYVRQEGQTIAKLSTGWIAFAKENNLKVNDACVFELIKGTGIVLRVTIFRANRDECCDSLPGKDQRLRDAIIAASSSVYASQYPSFAVAMKAAYVEQYMYVPRKFAQMYMQQLEENITLQIEDRSSTVKFCKSSCRFLSGWTPFVKENCLQVKDICIFSLTNRRKSLFKVSIIRRENICSKSPLSEVNAPIFLP